MSTFNVVFPDNQVVQIRADAWTRDGSIASFFIGKTCIAIININNATAIFLAADSEPTNTVSTPIPDTPSVPRNQPEPLDFPNADTV